MGYNANTKIISGAVGVHDVQKALSITENDVGRLCVHRNVNQWAKFKPQKVASVVPLTLANRKNVGGTNHFGLSTITVYSGSFENFVRAFVSMVTTTGHNGYKWGVLYEKPIGGAESPYRLDDFGCAENPLLGYCKDAELEYLPTTGSYSLPLNFRPELDGYTEARPINEWTINTSEDEKELRDNTILVNNRTQEEEAWHNFDPNQTVSEIQATKRGLSVSLYDILCANDAEKNNYYNGEELRMNRGILLSDGTVGNCLCGVGKAFFGAWMNTLLAGSDPTWYYAEFYTNAPNGNYGQTGPSSSYNYILLPGAFGQIKFAESPNTVNIQIISGFDSIMPSSPEGTNHPVDLAFSISDIRVLQNYYSHLRIQCQYDAGGEGTSGGSVQYDYSNIDNFASFIQDSTQTGNIITWQKYWSMGNNYQELIGRSITFTITAYPISGGDPTVAEETGVLH